MAVAQRAVGQPHGRRRVLVDQDGVDADRVHAAQAGLDPDRYLHKAFAAVWENQLNMADPATIAKLADESGLPGKQLVERSASEEISAVYEQNRQDALASDVFGSPVYVLDGEVFWGQDRIELLGDALKSGRAAYSAKV